jgi:cathepsin B
MFKLVVIGTIAAVASAMRHPINPQVVNAVRTRTTRWVSHDVETNPLRNYSAEQLQSFLGTITNPMSEAAGLDYVEPAMIESVPDAFDWRDAKGECVHPIRDQKQCGSCWAFAATEAFSDRFCIASNGETNVILSPQDMVSCDMWDMGCNGGILSWAWSYLQNTGVATDDCKPYVSGDGHVPSCAKTCDDGTPILKYKCAKSSVVNAKGPAQIQSEVYANGPVETGFDVYEDFMSYKSGIYHYTAGSKLGGHAVKIIGWGQENGVNYWICANSWGTSWGMDGFFNIEWGNCGIDSSTYACKPQL